MTDLFLAVFTNPPILFILCSFVVALYAVRLHDRRAMRLIEKSHPSVIDLSARPAGDFERRIEGELVPRDR